jgi:AraC-like DNA-binding protein
MLSVPLPFVVALLLAIMLVRLLRRDPPRAGGWVMAMIAAYAVQAVLLGLHWGYGLVAIQPLQAVVAAAIPPLSWLGFRSFVMPDQGAGAHALPPFLVAAFWLFAPALIDPALELLFVGYGVALLRLARRGPDALAQVTLDGAIPAVRALQATGGMLIVSAAIDEAIALDIAHGHGQRAGLISGLANLVFVALLGWVAVIAGESATASGLAEPVATEPAPDPGDTEIVASLDALMRDRKLHHDPNLSLDRLARRMGLPARALSAAINRTRGLNVSQYVNAHRVADACGLLTETRTPITRILLDVGFQTKSNFNREFLRIKGVSPSAWRRQTQADQAGEPRQERRETRP